MGIEKNVQEEEKDVIVEQEELPLVLEVVPGQQTEGLIGLYEAGDYENKDVLGLVNKLLNKDYSVEKQELVKDIQAQLDQGKLIYKGSEITDSILDYVTKEKTSENEDYNYIRLKAIKPQEGGSYQ